MSVRETAAALDVPKSTVARQWREGHQCNVPVPVWGSVSAWREAHAAIWAHNPRELADTHVPYAQHVESDRRIVKRESRGIAVLAASADVAWERDEPTDR